MGDVEQVLEVESRRAFTSRGVVAVLGTGVGIVNTMTCVDADIVGACVKVVS